MTTTPFSSMVWMSIMLDSDLNITGIDNPDGRLLFGIGTVGLTGLSLPSVFGETAGANARQAGLILSGIRRAQQQKRNVYVEYTSMLAGGERVHVTANVGYGGDDVLYFNAAEVCDEDFRRSYEAGISSSIDMESLSLMRKIYENLPVGMEMYDRDGRLIEINSKDMEMLGIRDKNSILGVNIFDNPNIPQQMKELMRAGENTRFMVEYDFGRAREYSPDIGSVGVHYFDVVVSVIHDERGDVDKYLLGALDITDRVLLEKRYEKLDNRSRTVLEALPVGVEFYDPEGEILFMNEADCRIFGVSSDFYLKNKVNIFDNPNLPEEVKDAVRNKAKVLARFEYSFDRIWESGYYETENAGKVRHIECNGTPILNAEGKAEGYAFIVNDVTDAVRAEEALRQSQRKTELAMQASEITLWEFDLRTEMFVRENASLSSSGDKNNLTIDEYIERMHPEDREQSREMVEGMLRGEDRSYSLSVRIKSPLLPDWQYYTIIGSPYEKDASGKVVKYVGFRKNNTNLQRTKVLQERILNSIPLPILIKDVEDDYRYVFCNEESQRMFGTVEGETVYSVMDESQAERMQKSDREVFVTGQPYFGNERIVLKDGRIYETVVRKSVIYDGDKRLMLNVRWDQSLENDLKRRAKVLSISLEAMDAYTWFYEPDRDKVTFGEGFDKTGRDPSEVNSLEKYAVLIHPEDKERFVGTMQSLLEGNSGEWAVEYRIDLRGDGTYEWWETRGVLETLMLNEAPYRYMIGMSISIETHKQTELTLLRNKEELHKLISQNELVLNNTNSGLAYITTDYVVQWENVSMCSASLSYEAYKKGEHCYKSAHNRSAPCENCVLRRSMQSGQMERIKFCLENQRIVEVYATPVFAGDGRMDGIVIRVDDVTDMERMIEELRQAKLQAEQSDKLKSAFLANMSHEIRTPLNAIVGFSDLLMNTDEEAEKEEYMHIINANNELLLRLINDILDLSKIEAGSVELRYEDFDLSGYFDDMAASMKQRVTNPQVRLTAVNPFSVCNVRLDKNRVQQLMTNYVTNAIKYTPRGFIEMGYEQVEGGIRLYVRDSGIGIPDEKKDKVFHRFEKLDEFAQGTGLGLSICKAIAESMGGSVGFESTAGEGSLFWVVMPCEPQVQPRQNNGKALHGHDMPESGEMPAVDHGVKKTILVAEDIPSNYLLISALLQKQFRLLHATTGQEAVDMARSEDIDLLLMDMKMPMMDGLTATAEIRRFNKKLPIVALTAHAFESDKLAALAAGCDEYLVKPIDKARLMSVLRKYCFV